MERWSLAPFKGVEFVLSNTVPVDTIKLTEIKHAPIAQHKYTFVILDSTVVNDHVINLNLHMSSETANAINSLRKEDVPLAILSYYDRTTAKNYILGEYLLTYAWLQCPISKGWFPQQQLLRATKHPDATDLVHSLLIDDLLASIAEV